MVVAERQGREKAHENKTKEGQSKVRGPEWGPQVEQTALLASPVYIGQAQGEEKTYEKGAKGPGLSLLFSFGLVCPHTSRMYFPATS